MKTEQKTLKRYMVAVLMVVFSTVEAQIEQHGAWRIDGSMLIWQLLYDKDGSMDDLRGLVNNSMKADPAMLLVSDDGESLVYDMREKMFESRGDLFSGRVTVDVKEGKYRVTLTGLRRYLGEKTTSQMMLWAGSDGSQYKNGIDVESDFLNKKRTSIRSGVLDGMDRYHGWFAEAFSFKEVVSKKDDW